MAATLEGEVYSFDDRRRMVAVRVGLSPKVIRFPTDEKWEMGERVTVTVTKYEEKELVVVNG